MSSSVSVCDAQWERSSWLFSVYLAASSCSVPVLRKPVLQSRRPGRHNTTAWEQEGHETERMRGEILRQKKETEKSKIKKGHGGECSKRVLFAKEWGWGGRMGGLSKLIEQERTRQGKLRGPQIKKKRADSSTWTKEERASKKWGEGGSRQGTKG